MVQTCTRCSRANPPEALYCYFDGSALDGALANGGPVHSGSQPFPHAFTFPTGKTCRNFDQLALACQDLWTEAVELLRQGYLEQFLGGIGRTDLALAARQAAQFPDLSRALDGLLAKLPTQVLGPPQLAVEPREINLGLLKMGENRIIELHLVNQGMRLLHGSITCDHCDWLAIGDIPGFHKVFQFGHDLILPVHVRGHRLRANRNPLEGRLVIESNGGQATVRITGDVPVVPYPDGVLAGARSPRQIADKAKAAPKEACDLFASGTVAQWYRTNGWVYPVQGPPADGPAAVQQFFDALGLSKPSAVEINQTPVSLEGRVAAEVSHTVIITGSEKRPIYAHARCNQEWLTVGRARLNGRVATIRLTVPDVPDRPGERLHATVTIVANGRQTIPLPVTLTISDSFDFTLAAPSQASAAPRVTSVAEKPVGPPRLGSAPRKVFSIRRLHFSPRQAFHALPLGILLGVLLLILGKDISLLSHALPPVDPEPRLDLRFDSRERFAISRVNKHDPNSTRKSLTREPAEATNTCLRIDGDRMLLFGQPPGDWAKGQKHIPLGKGRFGYQSTWNSPERVRVRQTVEVVLNGQTRLYDTCLIHYRIDNRDAAIHRVGLRVIVNTMIGTNAEINFLVPGHAHLMESFLDIHSQEIPDYIQAVEHPDMNNPGTIAQMGLRLPPIKLHPDDPDPYPPERLVLCRRPINPDIRWDWKFTPINLVPPEEEKRGKEACVVLYWPEEDMPPLTNRAMAFTYGLGRRDGFDNKELSVTEGGSFWPGGVFTITAYVHNARPGRKINLVLPARFTLAPEPQNPSASLEQVINKGGDVVPVVWRVRIPATATSGSYHLMVISGVNEVSRDINVKNQSFFD